MSVVLPAYNAETTISESIQSIIDQTYKSWELIVINDGSIDNTKSKILSFKDSRIKYIENDGNKGLIYSQISSLIILRGIIDYSIRDYFRKVICTIGVVVVTTVVVVSPIKSIIEMGFFRLVVTTIVSSISILISTYIFVLDKEERNLAKQVVFKLLKNNE